jgi:dihydrolipoamide dehydrogenase
MVDPETERILGAGLVGEEAGELIGEATLAIEMGARVSDLELTIHPHPTLSETLMEAAASFYGTATHIQRRSRRLREAR